MPHTHDEDVAAEVTVTAQGRVSLPRGLREAAGFTPGSRVHVLQEDDGAIRLETRAQKVRRLRTTISEQWRGNEDELVADELAADRRAEAAREDGGLA